MRQGIVVWTLIGLLVACGWVLYGMGPGHTHNLSTWTIVAITAPASVLGRRIPMTYYSFILLNGVIYGLFGALAVMLGRQIRFPLPKRQHL
jgi:hypothetical protein